VYDSADFTSESAEDARIVRLYEAFGVNTITPQEAPGCPTSVRPAEDDRKQRYDAGRLQIYRQGDQRHGGGQRRCWTELVMRLRPPTSNGTDMVSELALFEDKILGIRVKV
jgi:hypothetical protein